MSSNVADFIEKLISLAFGAVATWLALRSSYEKRHQETIDRYKKAGEKEYAAQRDFEHLRRNQEQMKEAFHLLDEELKETREDMREVKGMLTVFFNRSGDSSGFFGRKEG